MILMPCFLFLQIGSSPCRSRREDSDIAEFESDSCSDDSGSDNLSRSLSNNSSRTWDVVSEDSSFDQESSCPMRDRLGHLYLQYVEMSSPYWRIPLTDKVAPCSILLTCEVCSFSSVSQLELCVNMHAWNWYNSLSQITELAQHHPALTTLKSVDLSPASWMAVAW